VIAINCAELQLANSIAYCAASLDDSEPSKANRIFEKPPSSTLLGFTDKVVSSAITYARLINTVCSVLMTTNNYIASWQ
jgi:hypothetical protein